MLHADSLECDVVAFCVILQGQFCLPYINKFEGLLAYVLLKNNMTTSKSLSLQDSGPYSLPLALD